MPPETSPTLAKRSKPRSNNISSVFIRRLSARTTNQECAHAVFSLFVPPETPIYSLAFRFICLGRCLMGHKPPSSSSPPKSISLAIWPESPLKPPAGDSRRSNFSASKRVRIKNQTGGWGLGKQVCGAQLECAKGLGWWGLGNQVCGAQLECAKGLGWWVKKLEFSCEPFRLLPCRHPRST